MFTNEELNKQFRYCIALTGDEAQAYDLLQDSLESFLRGGDHARSSVAYLRVIIRNRYIDQFRKEASAQFFSFDYRYLERNDAI